LPTRSPCEISTRSTSGQTSGATFYESHLLFDKHHGEQEALVDAIAERIQTLGGTSIAMAADVVETTMLAHPPRDREEPVLHLVRLIDRHPIATAPTPVMTPR
jgi:starvation-inducible DNA-binding protein